MSDFLFISDAAKEVKVESHVLRYWEEELHLPIKRNELGHRYYTQEDVERFKQIKNMKERGLQLKAIKMILRDGKLDVLSMEETGMDMTVKRNQTEAGTNMELPDAEIEDIVMLQPQSPISEVEMPQAEVPEARGTQPRGVQGGMPEARETQPRGVQGGMPEARGTQPRGVQGGMPEARGTQPRGVQGGMPEARETQPRGVQGGMPGARGTQPRGVQGGMPGARGSQSRMSQAEMPETRIHLSRVPRREMPEAGATQSRILQNGMSMERNAGTRMSEEAGGLAIDIIPTKGKEPMVQESREDKSRRLQWLLQQLIRQTLQENNIELCREIRDSVVKELDYQFRMQEEREDARDRMIEERNEEHYRKMDELIRKKSRRLRKMKTDQEQSKGIRGKRGAKAEEKNSKNQEVDGTGDRSGKVDEWDQWSMGTDEGDQKGEAAREQGSGEWNPGEKNKRKQEAEQQADDPQTGQEAAVPKKKRRFF